MSVKGFGRFATGGAGHPTFEVTSLLNSGAGTLRSFLSGSLGNRNITFSPLLGSGVITLSGADDFNVLGDNISILGLSNPLVSVEGRGIRWQGRNFIVDNLRYRETSGTGVDNFTLLGGCGNGIIKNSSFALGSDECVSGAGGIAGVNGTIINDITIQDCIIGPARPPSDDNALLALWSVCQRVTMYRNVFYHSDARMPRIGSSSTTSGIEFEFINNVISHWGVSETDPNAVEGLRVQTNVGTPLKANILQNYFVTPGAVGAWNDGFLVAGSPVQFVATDCFGRGFQRRDGGVFTNTCARTTPWAGSGIVPDDALIAAYSVVRSAGAQPRDALDTTSMATVIAAMTEGWRNRPVTGIGMIGGAWGIDGGSPGPRQMIGEF